MYRDRQDAGEALARELAQYRGTDAVVAAIPRGGLAVGAVVARRLGLDLEPLLTKKIGHPASPEFAIGVVNLTTEKIDEDVVVRDGISRRWLEGEIARLREALRRRQQDYAQGRPAVSLRGRVALIVDDGVATGNTVIAAARLAKAEGARRVVIAVPVAPRDGLAQLRAAADELVCPLTPDSFFAIGQFYDSFEQVDDAEASRLLREASPARR